MIRIVAGRIGANGKMVDRNTIYHIQDGILVGSRFREYRARGVERSCGRPCSGHSLPVNTTYRHSCTIFLPLDAPDADRGVVDGNTIYCISPYALRCQRQVLECRKVDHNVLRLRNQPTKPAPRPASRTAPGAGTADMAPTVKPIVLNAKPSVTPFPST